MDVVAHAHNEGDPFLETDACMEFQNLLEKTLPFDQRFSIVDYLNGEERVPVCVDIDGEDWAANFMSHLVDGVMKMEVKKLMMMKLAMMISRLMKSLCIT